MKTVGFIGMGNMAQALAAGFIRAGMPDAAKISAYAPNQEKLSKNADLMGFYPCSSLSELLDRSEICIMACKPYQVQAVLAAIGEGLKGKILLSVALGWDFSSYHRILGDKTAIQCIMPNTPALVGEGVMLFEKENSLAPEDRRAIISAFENLGIVEELPSSLMRIGGAISGCGPAFVDLMIEAYADVGVRYGLPRKTAYRLVSQTLLGAAQLQLESDEHPGVLKDRVFARRLDDPRLRRPGAERFPQCMHPFDRSDHGGRSMSNVVLIGMPASGKSTIGVVLAKILGLSFTDTDLVIQNRTGRSLQALIRERGQDGFISLENEICSRIDARDCVIATGGSVVYGGEAMRHRAEKAAAPYEAPRRGLQGRPDSGGHLQGTQTAL